jgi:phosphoglycerate dehydrogenase-like enzyme
VGYEKIDTAACLEHGVLLALTPQGTTAGVAEHTILLILALYKQLVKAASAAANGRWMQWELRGNSFELSGKRLGLAGFGRIGREVALRASAFNATILFYDPFITDQGSYQRCATLEELLSESDIVTLHLPLTPATRAIINAGNLRLMAPHAILINTSRGGLIEESALIQALRAGTIAGAGLDVLTKEPPDPEHPLLKMDNVLITPHIAAGTRDAFQAKMRAVFDNIIRFTQGLPLLNVVPELASLNHRSFIESTTA